MVSGWRIVRAARATTALSGEGAWRYGGRWNSAGVRVVYLSEHQSTAALEIFVHREPFEREDTFKAFYFEWPEALTEIFPREKLPPDWNIVPAPISTKEIGDRWVRQSRSPVLALPSVIVPAERNFLLNPAHRDFKRIKIHPPVAFNFDPRLVGR